MRADALDVTRLLHHFNYLLTNLAMKVFNVWDVSASADLSPEAYDFLTG
mgnify:CR=1 FL=1